MQSVQSQIDAIRERIARAAVAVRRDPDSVCLIAVSKTRSVDEIRQAARAGVSDFGENYLAEALPKIAALSDLRLRWHYIGAIQSNKTRDIAAAFDWVHTVDREKIARRLSEQRPAGASPLNVLLQVNVDREPQKSGVMEERLAELAGKVAGLPRLRVRGLMAIPRETTDPQLQRVAFRRLAQALERLRAAGLDDWDSLSMGMSADFETAISEGATLVRVGTAIFGPRNS